MRAIALASQQIADIDWHQVVIGVSGEQVGFSTFIGIGSIGHNHFFGGSAITTMRVDNQSAGPIDNIILGVTPNGPPQNTFTTLIMRGANQELILLNSASVDSYLANSGGSTFWIWSRPYTTTWPVSLNGLRRAIRFV